MFSAMKDFSSTAKLKTSVLTFHNDVGRFCFLCVATAFKYLT